MAWYHFIPGGGLLILAAEKIAGTTIENVVNPTEVPQPTEQEEEAQITNEIQQYVSGLPISQQPTQWFKNSSGEWILKFANGRTIGFEAYKQLSNVQRAALSTNSLTTPVNNLVTTGNGSGAGNEEKSFFTTTNVLLGVGILGALGIVLFLIFRRNGRVTKR